MTKTLTPKQEDFLEALLGEARGNIRAAMDSWIFTDHQNCWSCGSIEGRDHRAGRDDACDERSKGSIRAFVTVGVLSTLAVMCSKLL